MKSNGKNFSIILPGGCNAKCKFCTDKMEGKAPKSYLLRVKNVIAKLPSGFTQVSITGGEPTTSPYFEDVLNIVRNSGRFNKVVLTTNGTNLVKHRKLIAKVVNHINISRHRISEENTAKVLGIRCISDSEISILTRFFGRVGVDVSFNRVYTKNGNISPINVKQFVTKAKNLGVFAIYYRYDQNENSLEETYLEDLFRSHKPVNKSSCPVCRSHTILIDGFPVTFKASIAEPSATIKDTYELILHTDGKLYADWSKKMRYKTAVKAAPKRRRKRSLDIHPMTHAVGVCGGVVETCGRNSAPVSNPCGRSSGGC